MFFNLQKRMAVPDSSDTEQFESADEYLTKKFLSAKQSQPGGPEIRDRFKKKLRAIFRDEIQGKSIEDKFRRLLGGVQSRSNENLQKKINQDKIRSFKKLMYSDIKPGPKVMYGKQRRSALDVIPEANSSRA